MYAHPRPTRERRCDAAYCNPCAASVADHAPGSGIWLDLGRTLAFRNVHALAHFARQRPIRREPGRRSQGGGFTFWLLDGCWEANQTAAELGALRCRTPALSMRQQHLRFISNLRWLRLSQRRRRLDTLQLTHTEEHGGARCS